VIVVHDDACPWLCQRIPCGGDIGPGGGGAPLHRSHSCACHAKEDLTKLVEALEDALDEIPNRTDGANDNLYERIADLLEIFQEFRCIPL
jgi:hypothetical protein